jgi:pimeloyl-ACP methyl ester carboxylesterase
MAAQQPLVFVHGYLGGSAQWAEQVKALSGHFEVITPDLPGFGRNNHLQAPERIAEFAAYVLNELDQQGIERFHLLGHSMGGMIVQEMVAQAPTRVDKLVLYGTGPLGVMPGRFETIAESKQRLIRDGIEATARRIAAKWFIGGESGQGYAGCAAIAVQASHQAGLAALSAMEAWSGRDGLKRIASPTLVLWGDQDQSYQWALPEMLWREIPGASLGVIPGCSHAVHLEKPALFNAVLLDFLLS